MTYSEVVERELRQGVDRPRLLLRLRRPRVLCRGPVLRQPRVQLRESAPGVLERVYEFDPPPDRITVKQRVLATVSLQGERTEIRSSEESASTTKLLLAAWHRRCGDQLAVYRQRYEQIKTIGARSFPTARSHRPREKCERIELGRFRRSSLDRRLGRPIRFSSGSRPKRPAPHRPQRSLSLWQRLEVQTLLFPSLQRCEVMRGKKFEVFPRRLALSADLAYVHRVG